MNKINATIAQLRVVRAITDTEKILIPRMTRIRISRDLVFTDEAKKNVSGKLMEYATVTEDFLLPTGSYIGLSNLFEELVLVKLLTENEGFLVSIHNVYFVV